MASTMELTMGPTQGTIILPKNPRHWSYFVIDIPVDSEGNGPVSYAECDSVLFEVWDRYFNTVGSFTFLSEAIAYATKLNAEDYLQTNQLTKT